MKNLITKQNYPKILLWVFFFFWFIMGISPHFREVWFAENVMTIAFGTFLILTYKKLRFSNESYTMIFIFMILHTIGSHYSYTQIPVADWFSPIFKSSRNYYDRILHFLFGFIFFLPGSELVKKIFKPKKKWVNLIVFFMLSSFMTLYELFEYLFVIITSTEIMGINFLGMQGDIWDAQNDILVAMIGALIMWGILKLKEKILNKKLR